MHSTHTAISLIEAVLLRMPSQQQSTGNAHHRSYQGLIDYQPLELSIPNKLIYTELKSSWKYVVLHVSDTAKQDTHKIYRVYTYAGIIILYYRPWTTVETSFGSADNKT